MQKWNTVTSVEIDDYGVLNIYENGNLASSLGGKVWRYAATNGAYVYAIGARGTIVQIDSALTKTYFDKRVENAQTLEWVEGNMLVHKDDNTSDVFTNAKYVTTLFPPSPTPTNTPTPTTTDIPTPTPTPTPSESPVIAEPAFTSAEEELVVDRSAVSFIKQQKAAFDLNEQITSQETPTSVATEEALAEPTKATALQKFAGLFNFKWGK